VVIEAVERGRPVASIGLEPLVDLAQRTSLEAVQTLLSIGAGDDHPGLSEDAQMLGHAWLA
jgi:hypothetical protein